MDNTQWYSQLKKPKWAPPPYVFGRVWSVLYVLIFISFGYVFVNVGNIGLVVLLPFVLNIFFNILFTPIQFKLRNNVLATLDILFLIVTLIWLMISIYTYYPWITYIQIPYLLWILIAFVLQFEITRRNWGE